MAKKLLHYYNSQDFPIAFNFKGTRITLWNKGDIIKDREGNPILDSELSTPAMVKLGLAPHFLDDSPAPAIVPPPKAPVLETGTGPVKNETVTNPSTVEMKVDTKSLPANLKPQAPAAPHVQGAAPAPPPLVGNDKPALIPRDKITEADMMDANRLVVRQEGGLWVFKLNNYENVSPAGMKAHIRTVFGKEVLERVKFDT